MNDQKRIRVYVWEFPVRLVHWVNFLCILTLAVTGFYIGRPFIHAYSADQYVMGWVRFIHFTAAFVFIMSLIIRIYWSFVGNKYATWKDFFPFTATGMRELAKALKFYLFLSRKPLHKIGHPALAGFSYLVFFLLFLFEIISGSALYSTAHGASYLWTFMGGWLIGLMELQTIRLYHHLVMYVILALAMVHIYIVWLLGRVEQNGIMGSIFSGDKFVTPQELEN